MSRHIPPTIAAAVLAASGATALFAGAAAAAPAGTPALTPPAVQVVKLVSDQAGVAQLHDPDLVNPWGMSHGPNQPLWVSDNGTGLSTIYTGGTSSSPISKVGLVVTIPGGSPTGQVYNGSSAFQLPSGFPARFIFASEAGDITGWYSGTSATTVAQNANAVYKGVAIDPRKAGQVLLAADFRTGHVDVFDTSFQPTSLGANTFTDPTLPAGFAPFNVAVLKAHVYVAYAKQDAEKMDDVPGPGHGFIDVYNLGGTFQKRLVSHGALNSPWALLLAPPAFGSLAGDLLVGNFGDGTIHAYNPSTGAAVGPLHNPSGNVIHIPGLWGLTRGDSASGGVNAIWFSAGPDGEAHGLLGVLRAKH